jgi:hypothetical protein
VKNPKNKSTITTTSGIHHQNLSEMITQLLDNPAPFGGKIPLNSPLRIIYPKFLLGLRIVSWHTSSTWGYIKKTAQAAGRKGHETEWSRIRRL